MYVYVCVLSIVLVSVDLYVCVGLYVYACMHVHLYILVYTGYYLLYLYRRAGRNYQSFCMAYLEFAKRWVGLMNGVYDYCGGKFFR